MFNHKTFSNQRRHKLDKTYQQCVRFSSHCHFLLGPPVLSSLRSAILSPMSSNWPGSLLFIHVCGVFELCHPVPTVTGTPRSTSGKTQSPVMLLAPLLIGSRIMTAPVNIPQTGGDVWLYLTSFPNSQHFRPVSVRFLDFLHEHRLQQCDTQ